MNGNTVSNVNLPFYSNLLHGRGLKHGRSPPPARGSCNGPAMSPVASKLTNDARVPGSCECSCSIRANSTLQPMMICTPVSRKEPICLTQAPCATHHLRKMGDWLD